MKNMKKILALALVIVSVLAISVPALAAAWTWRYGTEVDRNSGTNNQVMAVQQDLNKHFGYQRLEVDGYFGDDTEKAVKDFQRAKGLTAAFWPTIFKTALAAAFNVRAIWAAQC